jgi:GntR family transcriptional repressor for pyruvate dehydrogenase complex
MDRSVIELSAARPSTTAQVVVDQLLELILTGKLRPGDQLPSEPELMRRLEVGRSTVREALRTLAARNLIEVRPGRGSFVREVDVAEVFDGDLLHLLLGGEAMAAVQEVRQMLETQSVAIAATRATKADLDAIRAVVDQLSMAAGSGTSVYQYGLDFHLAIAKATHNPVLAKLYSAIARLLREHQQPAYERRSDPAEELNSHRRLYEAIKARKPELARRLMRRHLEEHHHNEGPKSSRAGERLE